MIKSTFNNNLTGKLPLLRCAHSCDAIHETGPMAEQQRSRAKFLITQYQNSNHQALEKENKFLTMDGLSKRPIPAQRGDLPFDRLLRRKCGPLSLSASAVNNVPLSGWTQSDFISVVQKIQDSQTKDIFSQYETFSKKANLSASASHIRSHSDLSGNNTPMTRSSLTIPTLVVTPPQEDPVVPEVILPAEMWDLVAKKLLENLMNLIYNNNDPKTWGPALRDFKLTCSLFNNLTPKEKYPFLDLAYQLYQQKIYWGGKGQPTNVVKAAFQALEEALKNGMYSKATTKLIHTAILCGGKNALEGFLEQKGINLLELAINALKEQSYYKAVGLISCLNLLDNKEELRCALNKEKICLDTKDASKKTLLCHAAMQERSEVIAILQELGAADTNNLIAHGVKALKDKKYNEAIKLIEAAIALGKSAYLSTLIKSVGININAKGAENWTALHEAASSGHLEAIKLLVTLGADVDAIAGKVLWTPLSHAVVGTHSKATETLLNLGANVHSKDILEDTPLHLAAKESSPEIVRLLLDKQARLNAPDLQGHTPLHLAAKNGKTEVLQLLLELDADVGLIDKNGKKALDLAIENNHIEAIQLLEAPLEKNNPPGSLRR